MPLKSMRFVHLMLVLFCGLLAGATLWTSGFLAPAGLSRTVHLVLGLITAVALILSHSLASFYLIETGINIKRAVAQHELSDDYIEETKVFKNRVFPLAFWSMVFVGAGAVVGGALDSGALPRWLHKLVALAGVGLTVVAWKVEDWSMASTRRLIHRLNREVGERAAAREAAGEPAPEPEPAPAPVSELGEPEEAWWLLGRWLVFLAISVWILYGYRKWVIGVAGVGIWPYATSFVVLLALGWGLQVRFAYGHEPGETPPTPAEPPPAP